MRSINHWQSGLRGAVLTVINEVKIAFKVRFVFFEEEL